MHAYYYTFKNMHKRVLGDAGCKTEVQLQNPMSIQQYITSMVPLRCLSHISKNGIFANRFLMKCTISP
jgi:hypothetical protein